MKEKNELSYRDLKMICNQDMFKFDTTQELEPIKVGHISQAQLRKIAEYKLPDLNCNDVEAAMKIVAGAARNMGIVIDEK